MTAYPAPPGASDRSRAGRDIAAQLVLRVLNLTLGVAVTLVTVRALGDTGFGQWATLLAVVAMAGYVGSLGLDRVGVERAAAVPGQEAEWIGALVTLRTLLAIPATVAAGIACVLVSEGSDMRDAGLLVITTLVSAAVASAGVIFQLQVRNRVLVALEVVGGVLWAAVVAGVWIADAGIVTLAVGFAAVTNLMNALVVVLALRAQKVRVRGARERWGTLLRLGLPVGLGGLLVLSYGYIDQVIVFRIAGAEEAGLYGAAYRILERIQFIPATLVATLFPIIVAARDTDPERARRIAQTALDYLAIGALPALALAIAGARPIVVALFGSEFAGAAPAFPVLMAAFAVISVGYLSGYLVIAYGLQRVFVRYALVALVFNVAANLLLVPEYGFVAAAWVTLATEVLVTALTLRKVLPALGLKPRLGRVGKAAVCAALMAAVAAGLREAGLPLVVWAAAAVAVYGGALFASRAVTWEELTALVRREPA